MTDPDPNFNMTSQAWDSTFGGGQGQMFLDDLDPMNADSDNRYSYEVQPWQSSHLINAFNGGFDSNLSWNRHLRIGSPISDSTSFSHNLGKP